MDFHYIAIDGPIGAGKSALAERLAARLDGSLVREDSENPFLADFYADRPGAALQAQLFYLVNRHRQLIDRRQADLFAQVTVCDYIFEKDRIYAYLNLDDNELFIYQRLYDLLAQDVPTPDLVIYLQAPTDILVKRLRGRERDPERPFLVPDEDYLRELNEAYHHFFFHYSATSLLVIESSQFRPQDDDEALDALVKQIKTMGRVPGTTCPERDSVSVALHYLRWLVGLTRAETQTTERERLCLARHAKGRHRLAEIGVWHGVTTACLRAAMDPSGELSAVDPYPVGRLGFSAQERIAHHEVERAPGGRVRWIKATGKDAAAGHDQVDFIFIDGDHSFEGLLGDWRAWNPLVEPGGIVALHDSRSTPERSIDEAGSVRATNEVILCDPRFELVETVDSLTVVRRRRDV